MRSFPPCEGRRSKFRHELRVVEGLNPAGREQRFGFEIDCAAIEIDLLDVGLLVAVLERV